MARAAGGDVFHAADVIFLDQGLAERELIGVGGAVDGDGVGGVGGLLVAHIKDLIARAKIFFGSAMTAETPLHLQTFLLVHQLHLVDRAVAGVAANTFLKVNAVVEVHELRKLVDARTLQRLAGFEAGPHGLEQLGVGPDLRVAIHAGLRRRNPRETGSLNRRVTVAAVDAESGYVVLMAERNRLRLADARVRDEGRSLDEVADSAQCDHDKHCAENGGAGQRIRAAMKDLRHSSLMRSGLKRPGGAYSPCLVHVVRVSLCSE